MPDAPSLPYQIYGVYRKRLYVVPIWLQRDAVPAARTGEEFSLASGRVYTLVHELMFSGGKIVILSSVSDSVRLQFAIEHNTSRSSVGGM